VTEGAEAARAFASQYCADAQRCIEMLSASELGRFLELVEGAYRHDTQVFVLGNGGSATTASHMACDLAKNIYPFPPGGGIRPFRVTSLTDNVGLLTALANDRGYERVFSDQLSYYLRPEDLVIAISASGNSPNVVEAMAFARASGARTAALLGFDGGRVKSLVDAPVVLRSSNYGHVENAHLIVNHLVTQWMRRVLAAPVG